MGQCYKEVGASSRASFPISRIFCSCPLLHPVGRCPADQRSTHTIERATGDLVGDSPSGIHHGTITPCDGLGIGGEHFMRYEVYQHNGIMRYLMNAGSICESASLVRIRKTHPRARIGTWRAHTLQCAPQRLPPAWKWLGAGSSFHTEIWRAAGDGITTSTGDGVYI